MKNYQTLGFFILHKRSCHWPLGSFTTVWLTNGEGQDFSEGKNDNKMDKKMKTFRLNEGIRMVNLKGLGEGGDRMATKILMAIM